MADTLALALKQARKDQGLTQEQLAAELFVTRQTVSNWENGRSEPDFEMLQRLSARLEIDPEALFQRDKPQEDVPPAPETAPTAAEEVSPETQACAETVVQPPSSKRTGKGRLLLAALLALALGSIMLFSGGGEIRYTQEWFEEKTEKKAGHTWFDMYVRPNEAPRMLADGSRNPVEKCMLVLREEGGVGAQIDMIRAVGFQADGATVQREYSREELAKLSHTTYVNRYGLFTLMVNLTNATDQELAGVGFHIFATDDKEQSLEFRYYVPGDQL